MSSYKWPPEGGSGGSGDVVGPGSSIAGQLPMFADTTGKLLSATGLLWVTSPFLGLIPGTDDVASIGSLAGPNYRFTSIALSEGVLWDIDADLPVSIRAQDASPKQLQYKATQHQFFATNDAADAERLTFVVEQRAAELEQSDLQFQNDTTYGNIYWQNHGESDIGKSSTDPTNPHGIRDLWMSRNIRFASTTDTAPTAGIRFGGNSDTNTAVVQHTANEIKFNNNVAGDHYVEMLLGISGILRLQTDLETWINERKFGFFNSGGDVDNPPRIGTDATAATLVGGTKVIANKSVTAKTWIGLSVSSPGGVQGFLSVSKNPGTGFTINSSSVTDTSVVDWVMIEKF